VVGLFGDEAPASVATFKALVAGAPRLPYHAPAGAVSSLRHVFSFRWPRMLKLEPPVSTSGFSVFYSFFTYRPVPMGAGTLDAPCADQMAASEAETLARNALAKRSVYKQCLSAEAEPVSYSSSQVGRAPRPHNFKRKWVARPTA